VNVYVTGIVEVPDDNTGEKNTHEFAHVIAVGVNTAL
jgi:hypothetical protein